MILNDPYAVASGPGGRPMPSEPVMADVEKSLRRGGARTRTEAERSLARDPGLAGLLTEPERAATLARFDIDVDHLILEATEAAFEHGRQAVLYQLAVRRSPNADPSAVRQAGQRALRAYAAAKLVLRRGGDA